MFGDGTAAPALIVEVSLRFNHKAAEKHLRLRTFPRRKLINRFRCVYYLVKRFPQDLKHSNYSSELR